ncbi:MAG: YraN family protein [Propionivibrio sp.]
MTDNDTTRRPGDRDGRLAEDLAARFLERKGLKIAVRNYRCRAGEIDLVCREGKALVFVEVRLRRNAAFGGAAASVTSTKQRRIILAAQHFLTANALTESDCRFDCILMDGVSADSIEWLRDAFTLD